MSDPNEYETEITVIEDVVDAVPSAVRQAIMVANRLGHEGWTVKSSFIRKDYDSVANSFRRAVRIGLVFMKDKAKDDDAV